MSYFLSPIHRRFGGVGRVAPEVIPRRGCSGNGQLVNNATTQDIVAALPAKGWLAVYADLIKARLTALVLLTTLVGFYVGVDGPMNYALMFHVLFGTALVASGAAALNQLLEREYDARMRRTAGRPCRRAGCSR